MKLFSKTNWQKSIGIGAVVIFVLALFVRFVHYDQFLYFIYDQGRDALKLQSIVNGDLTLIGPTTGLQGLFLGPLWYYVGVPGYILSQGNPYSLSLWFIGIASLALPIFFLLGKVGFPKNRTWQLAAFALLALLPGSVNGSVFIWNPLLSLVLLSGALYALFRSRNSRLWLLVAFLCLGFTLHSEFAYGIFLLPSFFILIFWLRKRFSIIDYLVAGIASFSTFIPQLLFELKNNFLMTHALLQNMSEGANKIPLWLVWLQRPQVLLSTTAKLFTGSTTYGTLIMGALLPIIVWGGIRAWKNRQFFWQIVTLASAIPYAGFMMWTGNGGSFYDYYLTPHFIPVVLLLCYGLSELNSLKPLTRMLKKHPLVSMQTIQQAVVVMLLTFSAITIANVTLYPKNEAGMKIIDQATIITLTEMSQDAAQVAKLTGTPYTSTVATYTPNYSTAQYDYMMWWRTTTAGLSIPNTVVRPDDALVYMIIEPDHQIPEKRFTPWYDKATDGRILIRTEQLGVLTLETWAKTDFALENGFEPVEKTVKTQWCW